MPWRAARRKLSSGSAAIRAHDRGGQQSGGPAVGECCRKRGKAMLRQRGEDGGKQPKILRETQGLGFAVARPNRFRQTGGARRKAFDKIAGNRLARADQPDHEQADGTGAAGRPLRQTGKRKKQRHEAVQPLSVFRDGLVETHAGLRWSSAQCAAAAKGCGQNGEKKLLTDADKAAWGLPSSFEAPLRCAPQDEGGELGGGNPLSCKI
jgi:hypothetical protein